MNKYERKTKQVLQGIKEGKGVSLLKILRLKCLDCCCWQEREVRLCPAEDCILHPFRFGKKPEQLRRKLTEKQKEALRKGRAKSIQR